ncbi:MAG: type ISP restriction/modification enzyme, partial [Candidatus Hodarchaeota archaeon]
NIQPLSDDYVKFIRIAQWLIEENQVGIVAFITNNSWLDSRIFRIMRKELSRTFNNIYIVNLHGNVRKKQKGNPFDIMVGVCIVFFVRSSNQPINKINILYRDISTPSKQEKLHTLTKSFDLSQFQPLPITPEYLFIPIKINSNLLFRYQKFIPLDHLFKHIVCGIKTHRDKFLVNTDKKQLQRNIRLFFEDEHTLREQGIFLRSTRDWFKEKVQKSDILDIALSNIKIEGYRGFDSRFLCYNEDLLEPGCSRRDFMKNISKENPAICVTKQLITIPFNHAFITDKPFDICFLSTNSKESAYGLILNHNGNSNLKVPKLSYKVDPEEVFYYIYGILNSSVFRLRYEECLVRNFPCIPFTEDEAIFKAMSHIGERLANLHLLNSPTLNPSRFPINKREEWRVINYKYNQELQRIYIESSRVRKPKSSNWIGSITPEMWQYKIGNLAQLENWLKVRKNNGKHQKYQLTNPLCEREILQFLIICDSIAQTLDILPKINEIYQKIDP